MARKNEIVIVGAGKFGSNVAKKLSEVSKYTIIVVDNDKEKVDALAKYVDNGFVANLAVEDNLDNLGLSNAGTWILGIGDNIQDSLIIASLIRKKYPHARILAKAADTNHMDILNTLGIDEVISPELAAARWAVVKIINPTLDKNLKEAYVNELDGGLAMIRIPILEGMENKKVMELSFPKNITINVIYRKKKPIIVDGKTVIKPGDEMILLGKNKAVYKYAMEIEELNHNEKILEQAESIKKENKKSK